MPKVNRDEWTSVVRRVSRWPRKDQLALVQEFGDGASTEAKPEKPRKTRKPVEESQQGAV